MAGHTTNSPDEPKPPRQPSRPAAASNANSPSHRYRTKLFHRRCRLLGIRGITPHSYRYAWAEGAALRSYPERFAQAALGHNSKAGHRWTTAAKDRAFDLMRRPVIAETRAGTLIAVLNAGTVSTNVHLRKLHNYCLDMAWLPWPIIPERQWPAVRYAENRAIRFHEHFAILDREPNPERRAFYELCWHLGGAQGDIASLTAEDIDLDRGLISYLRRKTHSVALIRIGDDGAPSSADSPDRGLSSPTSASSAPRIEPRNSSNAVAASASRA